MNPTPPPSTTPVPTGHRPTEVAGPLFSTGMRRSWHTRLAIALFVVGLAWGFIPHPVSSLALSLFFLACALGLLGEVPSLLAAGEVRASKKSSVGRFLIIRRAEFPGRFYFHVAVYAILGAISLLLAVALAVGTLSPLFLTP